MAAWVLGALNTPFGGESDGETRGFDLNSLPETSLIRSLLSLLLVPKGKCFPALVFFISFYFCVFVRLHGIR